LQVGKETNEELRQARRKGLDIEKVLAVARREMANENEATRLEALRWISALLDRHRTQVGGRTQADCSFDVAAACGVGILLCCLYAVL
jgi:hypothetical protein